MLVGAQKKEKEPGPPKLLVLYFLHPSPPRLARLPIIVGLDPLPWAEEAHEMDFDFGGDDDSGEPNEYADFAEEQVSHRAPPFWDPQTSIRARDGNGAHRPAQLAPLHSHCVAGCA